VRAHLADDLLVGLDGLGEVVEAGLVDLAQPDAEGELLVERALGPLDLRGEQLGQLLVAA
jgi:hypothetical protein